MVVTKRGNMSYNGDKILEFEEQNWTALVEKFLNSKDIVDKWEQFVYDQYCQSIVDREPPGEDR